MALRDVTNTRNYHVPQVQLDSKYAPLIRRGTLLEAQASRSSFPMRRAAGHTNIDLWVDGRLYPVDPATERPPAFRSTKEYLEFLGDGEGGMLDYTKRLGAAHVPAATESTILSLQSRVAAYEVELQQLRLLCHRLGCEAEDLAGVARCHVEDRRELQSNVEALEAKCAELRLLLTGCEESMQAENTEHQQKVNSLAAELQRCEAKYQKMEATMRAMVQTPRGFRRRVHGGKMKSFHDLVGGSGHMKRQVSLLRRMLQPSLVAAVQRQNKALGGKKRLAGDSRSQVQTAVGLASILRPAEASALLEQPRMGEAKSSVEKSVVKKISTSIGADSMLWASDGSGVTMRGYTAVYKTVKNRVGLLYLRVKTSILPAPNRLSTLRKEMNAKLLQFIGDYYWIEGSCTIPEVRVGGKIVKAAREVILDCKNNLFVELEAVQRAMVLFYKMTVEGVLQVTFVITMI